MVVFLIQLNYDEQYLGVPEVSELNPIFIAYNQSDYLQGINSQDVQSITRFQENLLLDQKKDEFQVPGYCECCEKSVEFIVDLKWGGQIIDGVPSPNWRERLECPLCHLNNRQRLMVSLIKQYLKNKKKAKIYFMESVTAIFQWAQAHFSSYEIIGSEYLGFQYSGGEVVNGIRHEDAMNLSFKSGSFDLIISNDVFEHVPDAKKAFQESYRILKSDGCLLATIPFYIGKENSSIRSEFRGNELVHLSEPQYHGNPVSEKGSLVFTDFGWDLLDQWKQIGFNKAQVDVYASKEMAHLGGGQLVFRVEKNEHFKKFSLRKWFNQIT